MSARLVVQESVAGGQHRVSIEGELDACTAPQVEAAVLRACRSGIGMLILDLQELRFLDSSGIRAILGAVQTCSEYHCELAFLPSRHGGPTQAFRTLGLDRVLKWWEGG